MRIGVRSGLIFQYNSLFGLEEENGIFSLSWDVKGKALGCHC